jgi:hypothetical protein
VQIRALSACDCTFVIECPDDEVAGLVDVVFGGLLVRSASASAAVGPSYHIERDGAEHAFRVRDGDGSVTRLKNADSLLFHLDKSLTLALQRRRPDLFFLHAAAVALRDRVAVLAAPPGTGKSTLAMALLDRGFTYLSDELAPIDITSLLVCPYPHAVCLKSHPVRVPQGALAVGRRFHVSPGLLAAAIADEPLPVAAFVFLRRGPGSEALSRRLRAAAGATHLLANTLNALAHKRDGLAVAADLAQRVPSFEMDTSSLRAACAEVETILSAHPSRGTMARATGARRPVQAPADPHHGD